MRRNLIQILITIGLFFNAYAIESIYRTISLPKYYIRTISIKNRDPGPRVLPSLVISVNTDNSFGYVLQLGFSDANVKDTKRKFIFTCPAESAVDKRINLSSQYKNMHFTIGSYPMETSRASFHRENYHQQNEDSEIRYNVEKSKKCSLPITPSFVYLDDWNTYEENYIISATGFELYLKGINEAIYNEKTSSKYLKQTKEFKWFSVLEILFDPVKLNVKDVIYQMNAADTGPKFISTNLVQNYQLGKRDLFGCVPIDELYEIENQQSVFNNIFENEADRKKYFHIESGKFLVPVHLAPLDVFMTPDVKGAARTYGNIAPMWKIIRENAWKNIEDYLHHVVLALDAPVDVISGTYGTLKLSSSEEIYLGEDQVSVPLAFFKILISTNENDQTSAIILVTINNPYENIDGILCKTNECQTYGWQAIQNDDYTTGRTFCCKLDQDILKLLHIGKKLNFKGVLSLEKIHMKDWHHRPSHDNGHENANRPKSQSPRAELEENIPASRGESAEVNHQSSPEKTEENIPPSEQTEASTPLIALEPQLSLPNEQQKDTQSGQSEAITLPTTLEPRLSSQNEQQEDTQSRQSVAITPPIALEPQLSSPNEQQEDVQSSPSQSLEKSDENVSQLEPSLLPQLRPWTRFNFNVTDAELERRRKLWGLHVSPSP